LVKTLTGSEYQSWLSSLTAEQRAAVTQAVGIVMDMLLMLEGRMDKSETEQRKIIKRIERVERYLCFPESTSC
jgi:hypothetical protein